MSARVSSGKDSNQSFATPDDFMAAVVERFGPIVFDLAADETNTKHPLFWSKEDDSLSQNWTTFGRAGNSWLNCPFRVIQPWAAKCQKHARDISILFLTPSSMANWYLDHVAGVADVYELAGRLSFDGLNAFPKDCRLSHFHPGATGKLSVWRWRDDSILHEWMPRAGRCV